MRLAATRTDFFSLRPHYEVLYEVLPTNPDLELCPSATPTHADVPRTRLNDSLSLPFLGRRCTMAEHFSVVLNGLSESVINAVNEIGHFSRINRSSIRVIVRLNDTVGTAEFRIQGEHPRRSEPQAASDEGKRKNSSNFARNKRNRSSNLHLFCCDTARSGPVLPSRTGLPADTTGCGLPSTDCVCKNRTKLQ